MGSCHQVNHIIWIQSDQFSVLVESCQEFR
ncbi:unnamed protein product [Trichobilharzia regenti]|nr:unnamed protein product [Trichobilharzia regenti]